MAGQISINIEGAGSVWVDESFKTLSPEQQQQTVDEIATSTGSQTPEGQQEQVDWGDVPGLAAENALPSAARAVGDVYDMVASPIETAKGFGNLALGAVQKLIPGVQSSEKYADAVGEYVTERYGTEDGFKRALAYDPVGVAGDVAGVLAGGGFAIGKMGGKAAGISRKASTLGLKPDVGMGAKALDVTSRGLSEAGRLTDPFTQGAKGVGKIGAGIFGTTTGTGPMAILESARASLAGGETGKAYRRHQFGSGDVMEPVLVAQQGMRGYRQARKDAYLRDMAKVGENERVLNFDTAMDAFQKSIDDFGFKGEFPPALEVLRKPISDTLERWNRLDPDTFHTAEGFDALKKQIRALQDPSAPGTQAHSFAQGVVKAIDSEIKRQDPTYAKVMDDYRRASDTLDELERTLSLGHNATPDQTLRKLTSAMRDNVNTNFGARVRLVDVLEQYGATDLKSMLAGQTMKSLAPRGLSKGTGAATALYGMGSLSPAAIPMLAAQSPALVGAAAHGIGMAGKGVKDLYNASELGSVGIAPRGVVLGGYQAGRINEEMNQR